MVVMKDLRVLHSLRDEVVKQKLFFLSSFVIPVLFQCLDLKFLESKNVQQSIKPLKSAL